jgi:hypothetical protein
MLMLALFMLSGRMCLRVRCKVVRMAIVPHHQRARGKLFCITMRLTLRKGGSGGTGRSWFIDVVASAVAMLVDIVELGVVKLFCGSAMV